METWADVDGELAKRTINAMIGLWPCPRQFAFQTRMHELGMDDTVFEGAKVDRSLAEVSLEEVVMRFEQINNSTMSAQHRQIMDAEHLHMARLAYEMRSILPYRQLREVRVD